MEGGLAVEEEDMSLGPDSYWIPNPPALSSVDKCYPAQWLQLLNCVWEPGLWVPRMKSQTQVTA